jgi:LPXTG-motif cell wall-anchored protein
VPSVTTSTVPFQPPPELPFTGADDDYWPLALMGAALLIAGMGALAVSRAQEESAIGEGS